VQALRDDGVPILPGGVPLYGTKTVETWALLNLIFAVAGIVTLFVTLIVRARRRKDEDDYAEMVYAYDEEELAASRHRRIKWNVLLVLAAIVGVVFFFLTEDMTRLMVVVDIYTIVNGVLLVLAIIGARKVLRKKDEDADDGKGEGLASVGVEV
jgi:uncharacterized membrane protein HdeD (DUF308 family)